MKMTKSIALFFFVFFYFILFFIYADNVIFGQNTIHATLTDTNTNIQKYTHVNVCNIYKHYYLNFEYFLNIEHSKTLSILFFALSMFYNSLRKKFKKKRKKKNAKLNLELKKLFLFLS